MRHVLISLGLLLALLIASVPAFGQDRRSDEHSYAQPDKVRIRDLALDLAVDFDKRQLSGSATLGLEWVDPAQRDLVLDTRDLAIAAVEARNGKRKFREVPFVLAEADERFGSKLTITLPRQFEQVRIRYATCVLLIVSYLFNPVTVVFVVWNLWSLRVNPRPGTVGNRP